MSKWLCKIHLRCITVSLTVLGFASAVVTSFSSGKFTYKTCLKIAHFQAHWAEDSQVCKWWSIHFFSYIFICYCLACYHCDDLSSAGAFWVHSLPGIYHPIYWKYLKIVIIILPIKFNFLIIIKWMENVY